MKKRIMLRTRHMLLLSLCFVMLGDMAWAAGPWNYQRQLPAVDSGVKFGLPVSLSIDPSSQRYYVVDAEKGQLVSFDKDGQFLAAFNAGGELKTPMSMARTSTGSLWVVNRASNGLLYINPKQQKVQRFQPKYPDGTAIFPGKVAVDSADHLFVLDRRRGGVLLLDDNLKIVRQYFGDQNFQGFLDFKLKEKSVWALDGLSAKVYRFSADDGSAEPPVQLEGLQFPVALEVDSAGQLYVLDRHAGTVVVFGPKGDLRFRFLGKGNRHGQLWYAKELIFDWDERLCIADEGNGRIDILSR